MSASIVIQRRRSRVAPEMPAVVVAVSATSNQPSAFFFWLSD